MNDDALNPFGLRIYDRDGNRIGVARFDELLRRGMSYKGVAVDEDVRTPDGRRFWVSTVWLGLDHGFGFDRTLPPMIFETMVFAGTPDDENYRGEWQGRWRTEAEALAAHYNVVEVLRTGKLPLRRIG